MPFTVQGEKALSETYKIRLSPEDKKRIRQQAEAAGMSMAKFIRYRALGVAVISKADMTVLAELRRLGGLLKQSLSRVSPEAEDEVLLAMAALRNYARELIADGRKESPQSQ